MTPEGVVDEIVYRSYVYNRERFPEIKPERWLMAYPDAAAMERRYQESINRYANGMRQRDTAARHQGRPDHDMTCSGTPLKAGS